MASPQTENGYTKIANELLEVVVRTPLAGRHLRVWLFVLRKTYGYGKKKDYISLSQFTKGTFINRSSICKIIKNLVAWKTLSKTKSIYSINKNYNEWVVASRTHSGVGDNLLVASRTHTKETNTKEKDNFNKLKLSLRGKKKMIKEEDTIDYDSQENITPKKGEGRNTTAIRICRAYTKLATKETGVEVPYGDNGYFNVVKLLKTTKKAEIMKMLEWYLETPKFQANPMLRSATSADSITKYKLEQ